MRPIVIDANIVFAAFIRDGATREIILNREWDLRSPSWLWEEVVNRYTWLQAKSHLEARPLEELFRQLRHRITEIPDALVVAKKQEALKRIGKAGKKDAPYFAATLAVDGILWTHDTNLKNHAGIETITTSELLEQSGQ